MIVFLLLLWLFAGHLHTAEVPFADRLTSILSKTIFKNYTFDTGNIFGYLRGENITASKNNDADSLRLLGEDLEINTLDTDLLHQILQAAWRVEVQRTLTREKASIGKGEASVAKGDTSVAEGVASFGKGNASIVKEMVSQSTTSSPNDTTGPARRANYPHVDVDYYLNQAEHLREPIVRDKLMQLMKQSIYDVRYRMRRTDKYRKQIDGSFDYRIGVLCGALSEKIIKLQSLYLTVKHFNINRAKMIYYLIAYERYLAIYIDIMSTVETVYLFHTQWTERVMEIDKRYKQQEIDEKKQKELQTLTMPVVEPSKPASDQNEPAGDQSKPVGDQNEPAGDQNKPVGDQNKPVGDQNKPLADPNKPAANPGQAGGESTPDLRNVVKPRRERNRVVQRHRVAKRHRVNKRHRVGKRRRMAKSRRVVTKTPKFR